jgi:hypothetical protein
MRDGYVEAGLNRRLVAALLVGLCSIYAPDVARAQGAPPPAAPPPVAPAPAAPAPGAEKPALPPAPEAPPDKPPAPAPADPAPDAKPPEAPAVEAKPEPAPEAPAPEAKPAQAAPPTAPPAPATAATDEPKANSAPRDEMSGAGYIPGYKVHPGLGMSPFMPRVGGAPGGIMSAFGAPGPTDDWAFTWSGYMSASVRAGVGSRRFGTTGDQHETTLHSPPRTADAYATFLSTNSTPGSWVGMIFQYGNKTVTATTSFDTYNPTRPTNFYNPPSQYFINNAYLTFRVPPLQKLRLTWNVGFFNRSYGDLGQYGPGLYTQRVTGIVGVDKGAGETLIGEYDLSDSLTIVAEHGLMGPRIGKIPDNVPATRASNYDDPRLRPGWTHHAHVGFSKKGDITIAGMLHYLRNFTLEDRGNQLRDDPETVAINEANREDGSITVYGADLRMISAAYGYAAIGASLIQAENAWALSGLQTFGGQGKRLVEDYFGARGGGDGTLFVLAANYRVSLAQMIRHPEPFNFEAPDIQVEVGGVLVTTSSNNEPFEDRVRHKFGADGLYTFLPWLGVGLRVDRVVPSSEDPDQTFHVIAPRLQFKSNWTSHETVTLSYVKWFYGDRTTSEGFDRYPREELDDQMFGLQFGMWW